LAVSCLVVNFLPHYFSLRLHSLLSGIIALIFCSNLYAAIESYEFQNEQQRERYQQLSEELRCPKCQNQNLADSDSQIAADLRRELHQQLLDGKSDEAIVNFMRDRYGDFVLYKPRVQRSTLLLWWGPIGLIALIGVLLWRSRRASPEVIEPVTLSADQSVSSSNKKIPAARWINLLSLVFLLAIAVGSLAIYRHLGSLQAIEITELGQTIFSGQLSQDQQVQQQDILLAELDKWLGDHPDDERFTYMRARLLSEARQWDRAASDYQKLVVSFPEQDNMLAEYAQVLFLKNDRSMTPDALALLKQTLQLNPHNVTALGLLGMAAFEQKDYRSAVDFWQRLLRIIPQGTPQAEAIAIGVARAKELSGTLADQPKAVADVSLRVQVNITPAVQAKPDETVFVLLRAVNGPRMPLAAVKTTVAALAQPIQLDTANSPMRGQIDLAAIESFEVVARLSRSGQPIPAAGDWEGVSQSFEKGSIPEVLAISIERAITH
jgi:cytochrome c-type biogenesis protein CcmH